MYPYASLQNGCTDLDIFFSELSVAGLHEMELGKSTGKDSPRAGHSSFSSIKTFHFASHLRQLGPYSSPKQTKEYLTSIGIKTV